MAYKAAVRVWRGDGDGGAERHGLGVARVIVSGRLVYGWKFMREQIHNAVAQSMAGRLSGWSVEPGEATGAGLGGALEVAAEGFLTAGLV